ncbi:MFS transporter [Parasphingopyxis algicola]|uniref:spinster family MFS transporter n=1 Tax=Parasphingopyxis algicola TaxID=2026624 RepID=UPI0015A3A0A5|nr:MFS transporter [Parasphingopyxis algicola]QLC24861.1 MFS transporter [Parasphingopyxis algicola]
MRGMPRGFVLFTLTLAIALSFVDRQILSLLVAPVKSELLLSDFQISLLHGLAFALLYMVLGLPFGWLADHRNRKRVILAGIGFWSLMTATCGFARNFAELFLARIGVGVGEASLQPAAYSLLADIYPPEKLSLAISIFSLGAWLGVGSAFLLGGQVVQIADLVANASQLDWSGWRLLFILLGLMGAPICFLVFVVIREPPRRQLAKPLPLIETGRFLKRRAGLMAPLAIGYGLILLSVYAFLAWAPALLMRTYGWSVYEVGFALGLSALLLCPLGAVSGGMLSNRLIKSGRISGPVVVGVFEAALLAPCLVGLALVNTAGATIALLAVCFFLGPFALGSAAASVQISTPPRFRGQISAVYLLVTSLLGVAGGPALTAFYTDYVLGDESRIDESLALVGATALPIAGILLTIAARRFSVPDEDEALPCLTVSQAE